MGTNIDGRIWVWGGPTAQWGGSMENDCLIKGAEYFGARSAMYAYGPNDDTMLALLKPLDRVVCQIGTDNRNPGVTAGDTVQEAEQLSSLSQRFPNIAGALFDDFDLAGPGRERETLSPARLAAVRTALRRHNPNLKLHVATYTHQDHAFAAPLLPHLDVVTVWVWLMDYHQRLNADLAQAKRDFPGKPLCMGVFLHDYGTHNAAMPLDVLERQLDQGRRWLSDGTLQGMIILGDREIKRHPEQAELTRQFLARHFTT